MKQITRHASSAFFVAMLMVSLFTNLFYAGQANNILNKQSLLAIKLQEEKPISAHSKVVLHGEVDMLSYAYKEAGLTLSSSTLPTAVKNVLVGSPAYYADIRTNDKIVSASFKENRLCISVNRAGTPYYTEIRLASENSNPSASVNSSLVGIHPQTEGQMIAVGFRFYFYNHKVNYVDPNSDLYGKVNVGDTYVETSDSLMAQNDSQNNGLMAYPTFLQNGVLRCYPCRRKPIDSFVSDMAQRFRTAPGAIYSP